MSDVFISFSTRGGIDTGWIIKFRESLESAYQANYGEEELKVWEMSKNEGDFQKGIDEALKKTLTLMLVLDPSFNKSPQTLDEIQKYRDERKKNGEEEYIIKVIKRRGDKEEELRRIVDPDLLTYNFSRLKKNKVEEEYEEDSAEYKEEIEKIVKEIRSHEVEQRRKINCHKLLTRLTEMSNVPKIYVALGDSELTDNRVKFINELNETIKHSSNSKIRKVKVLPDDFTFTLFDHAALSELLCEENAYQAKCVDALLKECCIVIVPFETDNKTEAELYLDKIKFQLQAIKVKAQDGELPVQLLLNIPEILYQTHEFKHELNNPAFAAYRNIKRVRNQIITLFIESFMDDLKNIVSPEEDPALPDEAHKKRIYLIEYNSSVTKEIPRQQLEEEEMNRAKIRAYIEGFNFTVIPEAGAVASNPLSSNIDEGIQSRKEFITQSDGIIIYRGIREDETWCLLQQVQTYKDIRELKNKELKKDVKRAVFIDPAQEDKDSYDICDFQVITKYPPELKDFLWQVQQL